MNDASMMKFGLGAPVRRKEDPAFLTGRGRYVGDITPEGTLHAYVLRSPMAHASIRIGDLETARSAPGVHLVLTGDDVAEYGPIPCARPIKQIDGSLHDVPEFPLLVRDRVRFVGDAIAFVVADSVNLAKSAAELIEVDFEPLEVSADIASTLDAGAPLVWPDRSNNLAYEAGIGDAEKADAAFAQAERTCRLSLINNRLVANYMETRGCVVEYDGDADHLTLTVCTQGVHSHPRGDRGPNPSHSARKAASGDTGCGWRIRHQVLCLSRVSIGLHRGARTWPAGEMDR